MIERTEYPLWHGISPMGSFLRDTMSPGRLLVEGSGLSVRDADGNWFLDARSGLWNVGLGYSATEVKQAIRAQLEQLPFGTLLTYDRPPEVTVEYARRLRDCFPEVPWVRFGNSGSQMTETAVLVSRLAHAINGAKERSKIISFQESYHGMGTAASVLSGMIADFVGGNSALLDVAHLPPIPGSFAEVLDEYVEKNGAERIAALICEPLMGCGVIPTADDIRGMAEVCRRNGIHFIADEVTTGYGRAGVMSRCVGLGVVPDMIVLGKNMTSGYLPVAALMVSEHLYEAAFDPDPVRILTAGSTTDGHPVVAAAGLAVLDYYRKHDILHHVVGMGAQLRGYLGDIQAGLVPAGDVDGEGLMQRLNLRHDDGTAWSDDETEELRLACEAQGLLISVGAGCVLVVPPLIVDEAGCADIGKRLRSALEDVRH